MENNYFKRITIDGDVNRLPKEDGIYFVHNIKYGFEVLPFYSINKARQSEWLIEIDWYLQPFTPDSKAVIMPTPGEVYKEAEWRATNGHGALDDYSMSIFINACEWFRSQVREVELKKILEGFREYILKEGRGFIPYGDIDDYLSARKEGK